jgi:cysteine desulfurase
VPGIAAFGAAANSPGARWPRNPSGWRRCATAWKASVLDRISGTGVNGAHANRTPNTSNIYFDGVDGEAMVIALDLRGFAVSTGSACSSGAITPSHVLTALGLSADRARSSLRFSLGRSNTAEQVDALVDALEASVAHLRRISVHA